MPTLETFPEPSQDARTAPFTTFDGWLKCVRAEDLDALQSAGMEASFARFFGDPEATAAGEEGTRKALGFSNATERAPAYRYRRFSGGPDLPRARYYAVCLDEEGWDGGALAAELLNYVDPNMSGPVDIVDLSHPRLAPSTGEFGVRNPDWYRYAFAVTFFNENGWASPYFRALKSDAVNCLRLGPPLPYKSHDGERVTIYFPLRVERTRIDKVIDLRLPSARAWMTNRLFDLQDGIPTARYLYRDTYEIKDRSNWVKELAQYSTPALHLSADAEALGASHWTSSPPGKRMRFHAAHPALTELKLARSVSVEEREVMLLRLLTSPTEGGSPITEAIGLWLRGMGANALIYPSARMNAHARIIDGKLADFGGFNLVDYRNAGPPADGIVLIQRPVTWIHFDHLRHPIGGPPPSQPKFAGSFVMGGVAELQERVQAYWNEQAHQKWQAGTQQNAGKPLFPESMTRPVFKLNETLVCSVLDMRVHAKSGAVALRDKAISLETGQQVEVGACLLAVLRERVGDKSADKIQWAGDWFCFICDASAPATHEFELICPICEAQARWNPARSVPGECTACHFTQPPFFPLDQTRASYEQIHDQTCGRQ